MPRAPGAVNPAAGGALVCAAGRWTTPFSYHPLKPAFATSGDATIAARSTGSNPGIPPLTQDRFVLSHPGLPVSRSVGVEDNDFPGFNGSIDDQFITETLRSSAQALAAAVYP